MDALRWTARQSKVPRQFFGWFAAERQAKALGPSIAPRLFAKCPDSLSNGQPKADNLALKFLNKLTVSTPFNYKHLYYFWVVAKAFGPYIKLAYRGFYGYHFYTTCLHTTIGNGVVIA